MGRLNFILLAAVVFCSLKVVEIQHASRTLFVDLGREQQLAEQLDVGYSRLLLRQAALATGQRIDEIARTRLSMAPPDQSQTVYMTLREEWLDD